jgi:hypothetical protein
MMNNESRLLFKIIGYFYTRSHSGFVSEALLSWAPFVPLPLPPLRIAGRGFMILGLTQLACSAFGRAVLSLLVCAVFPRYTQKNRTQKIIKHHAVAGEKRGSRMRNNASA